VDRLTALDGSHEENKLRPNLPCRRTANTLADSRRLILPRHPFDPELHHICGSHLLTGQILRGEVGDHPMQCDGAEELNDWLRKNLATQPDNHRRYRAIT